MRPILTAVAALIVLVAHSAAAIDFVDVAQSAALDQPRINLMLRTGTTPETALQGTRFDLANIFGPGIPTVNVPAYLDTGASGILIGDFTADQFGIGRAMTGAPPSNVIFRDVGVGGYDEFHVSQELYIGLAPFHPETNIDAQASYWQQSGTFRTQIGPIRPPDNDLTDLFAQIERLFTNQEFNVVGMPAMTGKVVVVDSRFTNNSSTVLAGGDDILLEIVSDPEAFANFLNQLELRTYMYQPGTAFDKDQIDTNPGIPNTTHHLQLSYGSFDRFTEVIPGAASGPTLTHNPFVGPAPGAAPSPGDPPPVKVSFGGRSTEGSLLLDTGAAVSMISIGMAEDLHVRYKVGTHGQANAELEVFDDNGNSVNVPLRQFRLTIAGVGQQTTLAGFFLDEMLLRTMEGNALVDSDPNHLNFVGAPVLVHDIELLDPDTQEVLTLDGIFGMNYLTSSVNVVQSQFGFAADGYTRGAFDWITFNEPDGILGLSINPLFSSGDFNFSGEFDPGDIDLLYANLGNADYDLDGDGDADQADVDAFLNLVGSMYGDADLDGGVGGLDFTRWRQRAGSGWAHGDFDGDGGVGGLDFTLWRTRPTAIAPHLAGGGGIAAVPEPGTFVLALLAVALGSVIFTGRQPPSPVRRG